MKITDYLIENFEKKLEVYFSSTEPNGWKNKYDTKNVCHDEPWITLVACYSIFGDQKNISAETIEALNRLLCSDIGKSIEFSRIEHGGIKVEKQLSEITSYREKMKKDSFHLYPDIIDKIEIKKAQKNASFEGNTNVDLIIKGKNKEENNIVCFVEAKFLSDISFQTTYNPVRDQILRNIDCLIDYVRDKDNAVAFKNAYFFLLTPEVFKTEYFGCRKPILKNSFGAEYSRLYCYKMEEYKDWRKLKQALPHRKFDDKDWKTIADNIGWISYENFYEQSKEFSIIKKEEEGMIEQFFKERNLVF